MIQDVRGYKVVIEPLADELGGGYLATAPDLEGCMSDGSSPEEALRHLYDAIACWLEVDADRSGLQDVRRFA